jgi:hypothetical protein
MTIVANPRYSAHRRVVENRIQSEVDALVRRRIAECPYAYYFNRVQWTYDSGVLTLKGCVPTFYLKQMLQTVLRAINYVELIHNDVDVVSACGLSSVRTS